MERLSETAPAELCLAAGQFEAAALAAEQSLALDPDDGRAWEVKGLVAAWKQDSATARHCLECAQMLVPLRPAAAIALADLYHEEDRQFAMRLYLQAVNHPRADHSLKLAAAAGLDRLDWPHLAVRICRQIILQETEFAQGYFDLSYYLGRTGAPDHIVETLARRAIQLEPRRNQFRIGLAGFLVHRQRPSDAHALVMHLTNADLKEIRCQCCLQRLLQVYESVDDASRIAWCRDRLATIDTPQSPSERED
ncbi:hypothetical protein GC163_19520 [bacterium]|nr:hypothetical protein [bacterium]